MPRCMIATGVLLSGTCVGVVQAGIHSAAPLDHDDTVSVPSHAKAALRAHHADVSAVLATHASAAAEDVAGDDDTVFLETSNVSSAVARQRQQGKAVDEATGRQHRADQRDGDGPLPPEFFHGFAEGESTYEESVANGRPDKYQSGWEPRGKSQNFSPVQPVGPDFFHESSSGGAEDAWETHYPRVADSPGAHGKRGRGAAWKRDRVGNWYQPYGWTGKDGDERNYRHPELPAGWFDSAAYDRDGFGRRQQPSASSPSRYVRWIEKSVNSTLMCEQRGCVANTTLVAPYNISTEQARNCKLGYAVHPTDFDEDLSDEKVEWIHVNDVLVKSDCRPRASGCKEATARMLYPCLSELALDSAALLPQNGSVRVSAKITPAVDECPYEGNLLSGVVWLTCLVAPQEPPPVPEEPLLTDGFAGKETTETFSSFIGCETPGCVAQGVVEFDTNSNFSQCLLSVYIAQTDFDSDDSVEVVEYVKVDNDTVSTQVRPGKNPCKAKINGAPLAHDDEVYTLIDKRDVTTAVKRRGRFHVESKISSTVDECAKDGHLFAGLIEVKCSKDPSSMSQARPGKALRGAQPLKE